MTIIFNTKMQRYEVYGPHSVVRNGEIQPLYVCSDKDQAREYIRRTAK